MIVLLFLLWVLLCGRFSADAGMLQICLVGLVVAALAYAFARRAFGYTLRSEWRLWKKVPLLLAYFCLLVKEILVANWQMGRLILKKDMKLHPVIVQFHVPLKTRFTRVLLANSITLTPGTITAEIEDNLLTVHCVDTAFSQGLDSSSFVKMLERMEK